MEQEDDKMSLLRTFGFSLCMFVLFLFLVGNGLLGVPLWALFIIYMAIGFALYYILRNLAVEELLQQTRIIYIAGSVAIIISGFLTNIVREALMVTVQSTGPRAITSKYLLYYYSTRNIPAELLLLLIGLFAPVYLLRQFREKQKVPHREIIWSIICILVLYALVALLAYWKRTSAGVTLD